MERQARGPRAGQRQRAAVSTDLQEWSMFTPAVELHPAAAFPKRQLLKACIDLQGESLEEGGQIQSDARQPFGNPRSVAPACLRELRRRTRATRSPRQFRVPTPVRPL